MHRSQFLNINFLTWLLVCSAILFISGCDIGAKTVPAVAESICKAFGKVFISTVRGFNPPVNVRVYISPVEAGQEKN